MTFRVYFEETVKSYQESFKGTSCKLSRNFFFIFGKTSMKLGKSGRNFVKYRRFFMKIANRLVNK